MKKMIKKNWKQTLWKTLNVISSVALIANMSMIGVFVAPKVASATTYCPSGNPLYMWDRTPNVSWSHGQISGYFEGEYIPVQLELNGLTAGVTKTLRVEHQYIRNSVVGIERLDHVNAPIEPSLVFNSNRLNFSMSAATVVPGNPSLKRYTLTFTPTGSTATLYLDALLGPNAHLYNGASLHVSLPDCGSKDVPISVNQILYHSLSITKSDNPDPIQLNASTTYTINATSNSKTDGGEKNFTVTDTLPAGMSYVASSASPAPISVVGQVITWNFGTVADGTTKTITFQATGIAVGTHTNTASVKADGATPVTDTEPTTVLGQCGLVVEKIVDKTTAVPGDILTYTINYENKGNAFCTGGGVKIYDTISAGHSYVAGSAKVVSVTNDQDLTAGDPAPEVFPASFNGTSNTLLGNLHQIGPGEEGVLELKTKIRDGKECETWKVSNSGYTDGIEVESDVTFQSQEISVTAACYGKLKVFKYVDSGTATPDQWSFTLGTETKTPTAGQNWVLFDNLTAGNYTVTENSLTDYHQVSSTCTDVPVAVNQTATCEFHNTRDTGRITFDKVVVGGSAKDSDFTFTVDSQNYKDGDSATLPTGTYGVTESGPDGYTLAGASGICSLNKDNQVVLNVSVNGGVCTITNTRDVGTIIVHKNVVAPDGVTDIADNHNFTVTLDSGNNQTINESNSYTYTDVVTGSHAIAELTDPNYTLVSITNDGDITVNKGEITNVYVVNKQKVGKISGYKWNDLNGNGVWDNGEPGLSGWTINLSGDKNGSTTTNANGYYEFANLNPGSYSLSEGSQTWWINTASPKNPVELKSNGNITDQNFGNFKKGRLEGKKFNDINGNGAWDNGEPALSGWTIKATKGQDVKTTTTDANGEYVFGFLPNEAGQWTISEELQSGWTQTFPNGGTYTYDAYSGNWVSHQNFGNFKNVDITVCKYVDLNGNGAIDVNDPLYTGENGWTMNVNRLSQNTVEGCTTFSNLGPGSYNVSEAGKDGWTQTYPDSESYNFNAVSGQNKSFDFANFQTPKLTVIKHVITDNGGDAVASDFTMNVTGTNVSNPSFPGNESGTTVTLDAGAYSVDETGLAGYAKTIGDNCSGTIKSGDDVTCTITNDDQTAHLTLNKIVDNNGVGTAVKEDWNLAADGPTDINGDGYVSANVNAGTYSLSESGLTGFTASTWTCEGGIQNSNSVTLALNESATCTITNTGIKGHIEGYKFEDINGNGAFDKGDMAVANWPISLYINDDNSWELFATTTTDSVGHYEFTDLAKGDYKVAENPLLPWVPVIPDIDGYEFSVTPGFSYQYDFLNYQLGTISGYKWNDLNGNSTWDQDEPGIQNWSMTLSGPKSGTVSTDQNGYYEFENLPIGTYTVSEDTSNTAWFNTTASTISSLIIQNSNTHLTDNNFGNYKYGKISGYKYDNHEQGLAGWQICLTKQADPELRIASFDEVQGPNCVLTDANGYYEFANLTFGTYMVSETMQYGWVQLSPIDPNTHTVNVVSGTDSQHNDFVNRMNEFGVDIEKSGPATTNAGDQITYTLDWSINGNTPVYNAKVTDVLPANTVFDSADNGGAYDDATKMITWDLGTVTPDQSGTVHMVVKSASPLDNGTVIENTGKICGTGNIPGEIQEATEKCDTSTTTTTTKSVPVLGISKSNDKPVGLPGDQVNYTVKWSVDGNSKATNVTLTDKIPVELTVDTATISNGGTYNASTRTISWNLGTQVPHAEGTVTYSGNIVSPLANGTQIVNVAKITSTETDPKFWEAQSVTTVKSAPVLVITKVVTPTETVADSQVTYTVVIKNTGNDTAINVKMTDLLPTGFTFAEFGGSSHTYTLGNLAAGAQTTVTYKVNIGKDVAAGSYDNLAVASADNHPNVSAIAKVKIGVVLGEEALPKLTITKTADVAFINPGGHVTYHVTITNIGDAPAINVMLQDVMPAGFTFDVGGITKMWSLGDLAVGASVKVAYTAISDKSVLPGNYENIAVAWSDNNDKVTATVPVEVRKVQVLGAELPETGASVQDYFYFFAASVLLLFSLFLLKLTFNKESD